MSDCETTGNEVRAPQTKGMSFRTRSRVLATSLVVGTAGMVVVGSAALASEIGEAAAGVLPHVTLIAGASILVVSAAPMMLHMARRRFVQVMGKVRV